MSSQESSNNGANNLGGVESQNGGSGSGKVSAWQDGHAHSFVDDQSGDSHHGGTALVELDGALSHLGGIVKLVPSKVQGAVAVVTDEFGSDAGPGGLAVGDLGSHDESSHLDQDQLALLGGVKGLEGGQTIGDILGSGEADSGGSHQVADDGKHGHASVLDLGLAKTVELLDISVLADAKGVPVAKL